MTENISQNILEMKKINKSFSGVHVLKDVDFNVKAGEVHALMGENGAGKSTLMKILCGIYTLDSGSILYLGEETEFSDVREAQKKGIIMIPQELKLIPDLTVAQNIYIGREPHNRFAIDDKKMVRDADVLLKSLNININPKRVLNSLTVGKQQLIAIAKAISFESKILIMDEPTAALSEKETRDLFGIIRDLQNKGVGIIYISHRMNEIMEITNRISVMRDGNYVGTVNTEDTTRDELVKMMVGRKVTMEQKSGSSCPENAPVILDVRNLSRGSEIKDVSFNLKKGEILGFAGLVGAGRTEVARAVYGADSYDSGEIFINGSKVIFHSPYDGVQNGICYLSEDRARYGLVLEKEIYENAILASMEQYTQKGSIDDHSMIPLVKDLVKKLDIKYNHLSDPIKVLSGGNQQKVIIARWLLRNPDIYIFDEPTRGIDIGAKAEIYSIIEELASNGKGIIVISSELAELMRISDRILVMAEGRKTGEIPVEEGTQEKIMYYATQFEQEEDTEE